MLIRRSLSALSLAAILAPLDGPSADQPPAFVSLSLSKASAERSKHYTLFRCEASLDNATGKDLTVRSNFSSVFDGLELVVTTKEGKVLAQQGYTWHQSPFAPPGRTFGLPKGTTTAALVFPINDLPADVKLVKVRLVGTLPGSEYRRILASETIEVRIMD